MADRGDRGARRAAEQHPSAGESASGNAPVTGAVGRRPPRVAFLGAFAAIYLFWGATYLALRYAVADVPPLLTIGVRCAAGAAILYAWLAWRRELRRSSAAQWRTAAIAGALLFLGCHATLAWAEQRVPSGRAALLGTTTPLFLVLLAALRERSMPSGRVLVGLALGVAGVAVLTSGSPAGGGATTLDHITLVAGSLAWAVGSLVARHGHQPPSAAQSTAMQLAAGAVIVLGASAASGELAAWSLADLTLRATAALGFLVIFGTVLGFGAYTWLLRVTTPAAVGTHAFANPVIALALAWLVGDEPFSTGAVLAAALVVGAIFLARDASDGEGKKASAGSRARDDERAGRSRAVRADPTPRPRGRPLRPEAAAVAGDSNAA